MKTIIFLLLSICVQAQSWSPLTSVPYVCTQAKYDNSGNLWTIRQQGSLMKNGELVKEFPCMFVNECGLVGFEFAPDGFFLHISGIDSTQKVLYYDTVDQSMDTILSVPYKQPFSSRHRGGDLVYLDSALYVSFGYGANWNDAQDLNNLRGKVIKIDSNGIEILAFGLRNPFRFGINYPDLWIADVGLNDFEELNYFNLEQDTLLNYGWPCFEGSYEHNDTCEWELVYPIFEYPHNGPQSIIGGCMWNGRYHFCDHFTGFGGSFDSMGHLYVFPIPFPQYTTSMTVNSMNELVVSTWGGVIYKYIEPPLSIVDYPGYPKRKPKRRLNVERENYLNMMYGGRYWGLDGRLYNGLPDVPGYYWNLRELRWELVIK